MNVNPLLLSAAKAETLKRAETKQLRPKEANHGLDRRYGTEYLA
jgi:hypothetical protein